MFFAGTTFTLIHVVLSLIGIWAGFAVAFGLLRSETRDGWIATFLASTIATCVTGFLFPFDQFLPSHWVGVISLVVLAVAVAARYAFQLAGPWRWVFVVSSIAALYFNSFVLVVQAFRKIPALHALAPTESEPAFALAQGGVLIVFVILGFAAVRSYQPRMPLAA